MKLPPKAQHHRAWWSNNPSNNVMTRVWLSAGYESTQVDMEAEAGVSASCRIAAAGEQSGRTAASSYATKDGRHPAFGALRDITFVRPGVDLTEPV